MSDRRKLATDEFGRTKNAQEWIVTFLKRKERMRLKEIREELAEAGIVYANNKGLLLALKSLIDSKTIWKEPAKPYPCYRLLDNEIINLERIAEAFRDGVSNTIVNDYASRPVPKNERLKESMIHDVIQFYGAYMMYVLIQSVKIIDPKKDFFENRDLRFTWVLSALPFHYEILWFEKIVTKISGIRGYGDADYSVEDVMDRGSLIYECDRKMKGVAKIEEILKTKYSDYYELFNKMMQSVPKVSESREGYRPSLKKKKTGKND